MKRPKQRSSPQPSRRLPVTVWLAASALLAVGLILWMVPRRETSSPPADAARDSLALLPPAVAYERAKQWVHDGDSPESFPYYRRAIAGIVNDFWEIHFNYATALFNATVEYTTRSGMEVAVTRSSVERVQLMNEALRQLDLAERLAPTPAVVAQIQSTRGRMLHLWGFPWEAFIAFRKAQFALPSDGQLSGRADAFMDVLRDPTRAGSQQEEKLPLVER